MNRILFLDNLRSAAVILTLLAVLLSAWTVFFEASAVIAIAVAFFISAYFSATALRTHKVSFFLTKKLKHLLYPFVFLCLFSVEETWGLGLFPQTAWVLPTLFLLCLLLSLGKTLKHQWLLHRSSQKPTLPFLLTFFVLFALILWACRLWLHPTYVIPYLVLVRPDWLVIAAFSFFLGLHAFRQRWFSPHGFVPGLSLLLILIIILAAYAVFMPAGPAIVSAGLTALLALTSVFGLSALFQRNLAKQTTWSANLHRMSYGLFFVGEPIILNCFYFLAPLTSTGLKILLTALITGIYSYLLCRYILLHIDWFKSKG